MEGLAFPLCLLRCLVSASAHESPRAASLGLAEGLAHVLMTKHVRHKGLDMSDGASIAPTGQQQQQQVLVLPGSLAASRVCFRSAFVFGGSISACPRDGSKPCAASSDWPCKQLVFGHTGESS